MPQSERHLLIRIFDPADLDEILRLFRDTVRTVNGRDYSAEQVAAWAPDEPDRQAWLGRLTQPWTLVAEDGKINNGAIVGFGQLRPDGHVDLLYVHAGRQRQGIGKRLLDHLVELARAHGLRQLSVEASITAKPFFLRQGFETLAE
jgi:putative acetyltransferase